LIALSFLLIIVFVFLECLVSLFVADFYTFCFYVFLLFLKAS